MATPPQLRGIPLNTASTTDYRSFAPVYDPAAIRFARKVNFAISTSITLAILSLSYLLSPSYLELLQGLLQQPGSASQSLSLPAMLFLCLPAGIPALALALHYTLTPQLGFPTALAQSATVAALKAWLDSQPGDFNSPEQGLFSSLKQSFASPRTISPTDSESSLEQAAAQILRLSSKPISLSNREGEQHILQLDSTGRYQLTVQGTSDYS